MNGFDERQFDMPIVQDPFGTAASIYKLENARLQNRLMHMQMKDIFEDKQVNKLLTSIPSQITTPYSWQQRYGNQFDPTTGEPIPGTPPAGAAAGAVPVTPQQWETTAAAPSVTTPVTTQNKLAMLSQDPKMRGMGEAIQRRSIFETTQEQALAKADLEAIAKVHVFSPETANRMFNNNPGLVKMAGGPITMTGEGNTREYKDDKGNVIARAIMKPDGKWGIVQPQKDPLSVEAAYLEGVKDKVRKENPNLSNKEVLFKAAKQVREENDERQKEKMTFRSALQDAQKVNEEERKERKGFKGWTEEEREMSYWTEMLTGRKPKFAWGDRNSYTAYQQGYNQFMLRKGINPQQVARMQTDYKSMDRSVANQRKIYDMMYGFGENIKLQVGKVREVFKKVPRTQVRLLNLPIVELRRRAMGSGEEAAIASYLIEISNEIGKLSTGSAASIRELSESAQQQWAKIHDGTLPFKELEKVLKTTEEQADMRIFTSRQAMDYTRQAIEEIGKTTNIKPFKVSEPQIIEGAQKELERRRREGNK